MIPNVTASMVVAEIPRHIHYVIRTRQILR